MKLSVPLPKGHCRKKVYVFTRHGKAYHNATKDELQKLWTELEPTLQREYTQKAMERFTVKDHAREEWESLPTTERDTLSMKEMRYDAPLTEEGREEARRASEQLRTYINKEYPGAVVNVFASPLYRAYETASYLICGWMNNECAFSFTAVVNANFRELTEINREMQSANHAFGTPKRAIAESNERTMYEYALTVLKNPLTEKEWVAMSPTDKEPYIIRVKSVLAENIPRLVEDRPFALNGVPISHKGSEKVYAQVDLFSVLPAIAV
jgi:broad specificity phosphatase PhoE